MAAADRERPGPDHYRLLGVARGASREEIAQAWRRRARDEHPDARPDQVGEEAAGRFRALAEAYHVLSDAGRRAAYDRALGGPGAAGMPAAVPVPVRRARPAGVSGLAPAPGAPLRVGPVRVDGAHAVLAGGLDEDEIKLVVLAALALGWLEQDRLW